MVIQPYSLFYSLPGSIMSPLFYSKTLPNPPRRISTCTGLTRRPKPIRTDKLPGLTFSFRDVVEQAPGGFVCLHSGASS